MEKFFKKISESVKDLLDIKIDKETVNVYICYLYLILMTVITPIIPLSKGVGLYSAKTTFYIVITLVILFAYIVVNYNTKIKKPSTYTYILLIYLTLVSISTIMSKYGTDAIFGNAGRGEGLITIFCYIVTVVIFSKNFKYNEKIVYLIMIAAIYVSIYGIIESVYGDPIDALNKKIVTKEMARSTMGNPNFFSSYLTLILPIAIFQYFNSEKKIYFYASATLFAALICSDTLGGYITFIIYFLFITIYSLIRQKLSKYILLKLLMFLIIITAIVYTLSIITNNNYMKQLLYIKSEAKLLIDKSDDFATNRGLVYKAAIKMIKENPVFGVGLDCFKNEILAKNYSDTFGTLINKYDKAHSEYLQIAATSGILSLVAYIFMVFTIIIKLLIKIVNDIKTKTDTNNSRLIIVIFLVICSYAFQALANISATQVAPLYYIALRNRAKFKFKKEERASRSNIIT